MHNYFDLCKEPLLIENNSVWRTYNGGLLLGRWSGNKMLQDSCTPEGWVASTVVASGVGRPIYEGLSKVRLDGGECAFLKDIIESNPEAFLGREIYKKYNGMGVLVKILDSRKRLTIQVHPDKKFALEKFNSKFGKTEGWYILDGCTINGEKPYVLLGFKPHVTKELWKSLFEKQDIAGILEIACINFM